AWYAPREKVYINARYNHHRSELASYVKLRKTLGIVVTKDEQPDYDKVAAATAAILNDINAGYLAISVQAGDSAAGRQRSAFATQVLYQDVNRPTSKKEWAPWYLDGQTTIFGYKGKQEIPAFTALRVDPVVLAFAPNTPRVPQVEMKQPLIPLTPWEE